MQIFDPVGQEAVALSCSVKKVFYEISQNSQQKTCALAQVFSCEFCKISENTFRHKTPPAAASVARGNADDIAIGCTPT